MKKRKLLSGKKAIILFLSSVILSVAFLSLTVRFLATSYFFAVEILCLATTAIFSTVLFRDKRLTALFCVAALVFPVSSIIFIFSSIVYKEKTKIKQAYLNLPAGRKKEAADSAQRNTADCRYLDESSFCDGEYFSSGEEFFDCLIRSMQNAKKRIFLEYYIVKPGKLWSKTEKILKEKSLLGVKIILIFDNFGSSQMPYKIQKRLKSHNIDCFLYNRLLHLPDLGFMFRSHRKIAITDDELFLGSANVADEYTNGKNFFPPFKDCGVRLSGDVANRTAAYFLYPRSKKKNNSELKECCRGEPVLPSKISNKKKCNVIFNTPLVSCDLKNRLVSEIYGAKTVCICTPYLAPTNDLLRALIFSARNGAKIKIFLPGIPDKKFAYAVTKANAEKLSAAGIKIFTYTPGFLHSKLFLTENVISVGSANLDYRSAFFQREVAVFTNDEALRKQIKNDFSETEKSSSAFCPETSENKIRDIFLKLKNSLLFFLSPLF